MYFLLVIIYLGLAKALSPTEIGVQYLQNEKGFSKIIKSSFATAILIDTHATGFLIKTFYQKYRVIHSDDTVEEIIVRTNKEFVRKHLPHIGLSLYRKNNQQEEFLPVPPGSLYINNPNYGDWKENKNGEIKWRFHKAYKNFPRYLGWGKWRPNIAFFEELKSHLSSQSVFLGPKSEFGPQGILTQKNFPHFFQDERKKKINLKSLFIDYFKENF